MKGKLLILVVLLAVAFGVSYAGGGDEKLFGPWLTVDNLGPLVNDPVYIDSCVSISKDGLSLFFSSNRYGVAGWDRDMFVSQRTSTDDTWGTLQPLPVLSNAGVWESCPALSLDERRLYFTLGPSPSNCGNNRDIWVSRRHDRRNDFGWEPPVNLGCEVDGYVNSPGPELMPEFFEVRGMVIMYFSSGFDELDIFQSEMRHDDTFGPGIPVAELNSEYNDGPVAVRRDGLEVIFGTNRPGGLGSMDLWMATRESTFDSWSEPVPVEALNSAVYEGGKMSFSFDGTELYFRSDRSGNGDLYVARRERLLGPN